MQLPQISMVTPSFNQGPFVEQTDQLVAGRVEHYCTLFDTSFLPMGLALAESLERQDPNSVLWVLCLDEVTEQLIHSLRQPHIRTIALHEIETEALIKVRAERTRREYYWTLTPWVFDAVFDREPTASRVTYLDADLYFFGPPQKILEQMTPAHHIIVTHHAYAPEYQAYAKTSGEFCVQFITVARTSEARAVIGWWRDRCLEWCHAIADETRFGDQRYLESWPKMLGDGLLIINRADWTGAPWNACLADRREDVHWMPVFYHFHGVRVLTDDRVILFPRSYAIGRQAWPIYREYVAALRRSNGLVRRAGVRIVGTPTPAGLEAFDRPSTPLRRFRRLVRDWLFPSAVKLIVSIR